MVPLKQNFNSQVQDPNNNHLRKQKAIQRFPSQPKKSNRTTWEIDVQKFPWSHK
jgi:uncharacterized lipoprotein YmbA